MPPVLRSPPGGEAGLPPPSLRSQASPQPHKDLKVRFAAADEVQEFDAGSPAAAIGAGPSQAHAPSPAAPQPPYQAYWHLGDPSAYAASAGSAAAAGSQRGGQYQAPYGLYYHPYAAYPQYAAPHPGWGVSPPQAAQPQPGAAEPPPPAAPAPPAALPAAVAQQESKRMQLLARSVSITVNPAAQEPGAGPGPAVALSTTPAAPPPAAAAHRPAEIEADQEERMVAWARRRLRWASLHRAFRAWDRLREERWWKTQLELRDAQAQALAAAVRHVEARPVLYMRRYKLRRLVAVWTAYCHHRRAKAAAMRHADAHAAWALVARALAAWEAAAEERAAEAAAERRADALRARRRLHAVFEAWRSLVGRRARKEALLEGARRLRSHHLQRNALGSWAYLASFYATEKATVASRNAKVQAKVLEAWQEAAVAKRSRRAAVAAARARHAASLRAWAFYAWVGHAEGHKARLQQEFHAQMSSEMARLRQENERLARVVDSGDWERGRVAELTQAGQVLQQERDALLELVESLPGARARQASRTTLPGSRTAAGATPRGSIVVSTPSQAAATSRRQSLAALAALAAPAAPGPGLAVTGNAVGAALAAKQNSVLAPTAATAPAPTPATARAPRASSAAAAAGADPKPAPLPASLRNKMAVRTGSSFNALVRALKQDLVATGALARDPAAALAVDKVSMQRVELTAEGGLRVEGVANTAAPGFSFARAGARQAEGAGGKSLDGCVEGDKHAAGVMGGRSVAMGKRFGDAAE